MEKKETYREQQETFALALGKRVKALRSERGYSQEKVARLAEISLNGYKNIERGTTDKGKLTNPRAFTLLAVANAFDMHLTELLDFSNTDIAD